MKIIKNNFALILGVGVISCWIFFRMMFLSHSTVTGDFQINNFIEVAFARSILYPLVFPFYSKLNNLIVLILLAVWGGLIFYSIKISSNKANKELMLNLVIALIVYLGFTLYMRQSLTQQIGGYSTTFPDRYFLGLNLITIVLSILALNQLLQNHGRVKFVGIIGCVLLGGLYISQTSWLIETKRPRFTILKDLSFTEQLCLSSTQVGKHDTLVDIPIYFSGWAMTLPTKYLVDASKKLHCDAPVYKPLNLTDINWDRGVARNWSGFVTINNEVQNNELSVGRFIKFADGSERKIIQKNKNGKYLNIFLNGDELNASKVGYPNTFEVIK